MGFNDVKKPDNYQTRGGGGYRDELNELMGGPNTDRNTKGEEPEPGSDAYLKRRDKQAADDLKNAPRRGD